MSNENAPLSEADGYGAFLTALMGLEDDALLSGYSGEGISHLTSAIAIFMKEFSERYPGHWSAER
jgi:hypothetical protein